MSNASSRALCYWGAGSLWHLPFPYKNRDGIVAYEALTHEAGTWEVRWREDVRVGDRGRVLEARTRRRVSADAREKGTRQSSRDGVSNGVGVIDVSTR